MPPGEQFWELLLGHDVASSLLPRETQTRDTNSALPRDSRVRDSASKLPNKGKHLSYEDPLNISPNVQAVPDSDRDLESVLQMTGSELCRQPAVLHLHNEKISLAQDELAVQNCSLFLASSKALNSLRCSVENMSATLAEMDRCIQPLHVGLKQFRVESNAATSREASLHILVSMQRSVSQLLDLPYLVLNCCNGGLYDEAVDVLMFADARVAALRASGCCNMTLLDFLESQLKETRRTCINTMLRQLGQQAQLAASLKLVGPLRRLACSEGQLKTQFLHHRDDEIACQRHSAEAECEREASSGLSAAAELLRLGVLQTAVHYRAVFGTTDGPLSAWLAQQVLWFVKLVNRELLQGIDEGRTLRTSEARKAALEAAPLESINAKSRANHASKFRLRLLDLATVLRQAYSAAWALRRVQCFFFPAVALTFARYVVAVQKQTIEEVAAAFELSIDEYDFVPSLAYFSLLEGTPWFQSCIATNPCCLFLLRHAPLANLYNSVAEVINSFQECPVASAANGVICLLGQLVGLCIRKLIAVKPGKRQDFINEINSIEQNLLHRKAESEGISTPHAEFFVMCDIFACVLVPTVCRHISATFPSCIAPSPESLCAPMEEAELSIYSTPFAKACIAMGNGGSAVVQKAQPDTPEPHIEQLTES